MGQTKVGYVTGTGSALNVSIGFIPDYLKLTNITDGDVMWEGTCNNVFTFTSGGTTQVKTGDILVGATSGATVQVKDMLALTSGSWAGGDAAGSFIGALDTQTGTFSSTENLYVQGGTSTNDLTLASGFPKQYTTSIDTEVANEATNTVTAYVGSTTAGRGFTLASGVSESGDLLHYVAIAND